MKNTFEKKYSSKINPLYIPLPEFKFFHGASSEEEVDDKFIGRENIIERLKSWLTEGKTKTGVYLVTGYRGMGKSSFVGKVLSEITEKVSHWQYRFLKVLFTLVCTIVCLFIFDKFGLFQQIDVVKKISEHIQQIAVIKNIVIAISENLQISIFLIFVIAWLSGIVFRYSEHKYREYRKNKKISIKLDIRDIKHKYKECRENRKRIPIKLNLGHETLNERDILSLVSNSIEYKYRNYLSDFSINWTYLSSKNPQCRSVTMRLQCN